MESPSTQAADSAMLLHHLDSMPPGGSLHRRRVSRTPQVQTEDVFYTPRNISNSPQSLDPRQSPYRSQWPTTGSPRGVASDFARLNLGGSHHVLPRPAAGGEGPSATQPQHNPHGSQSRPENSRTDYFRLDGLVQDALPAAPPAVSPQSKTHSSREGRRRCTACEREISGHFVRALGGAYHISCFTCNDCGVECASKFFPMNNRPFCEHCYFKRQNLLCYRCNGSLRGSYITALNHKYHVEHFTCSLCPMVFGPDDSYFEHEGSVYCRSHYAALFAYRCEGCSSPILKQFVETPRGGKNLRWHPECYMIYKFWSVKVEDTGHEEVDRLRDQIAAEARAARNSQEYAVEHPVSDEPGAQRVQQHEDAIEALSMRIWTTLCGYEEACGDQISGLVQAAVNGDFMAAYFHCTKLVALVNVLFKALDLLPPPAEENAETEGWGKEAKTLCRKIVSYMSLLSKTRQLSNRDRVAGLARDLLSLASSMAHYLKVLIRYGLSRSLRARHAVTTSEDSPVLDQFLNSVARYAEVEPAKPVSPFSSDRCGTCGKSVEDRCYREISRNDRLWHATEECFTCSNCHVALDPSAATVTESGALFCLKCTDLPARPFVTTTKLEQYIVLLHVALARLDLVLSNHKRAQNTVASGHPHRHAGDQKAMISSTPPLTIHQAFTESPVSSGASSGQNSAPSTLERTSSILHSKRGLTLDDIRRIVASEQAHSAEQKRAKQPSSQQQQSKLLPPKRDPLNSKPELGSYPSSSVLPNGTVSANRDHFFGCLDDDDYLWIQYIAHALFQPVAKDVLHMDLNVLELDSTPGLSSKPTSQGASGASIWERMGKVFTGGSSKLSANSSESSEVDKVFGQPLDKVTARHGIDSVLGVPETGGEYTLRIPSFVDDCIGAMRQKDMSVEGVFRKNGNIRRLREFVEKIDKFPDESGLLVDESPIQLAALLKKFLRDLPDPLLTSRLAKMWIAVSRLDHERQLKTVPLLICMLPRVNRNVFETLVHFLNWVSGFAQLEEDVGSKMDISNLATVLAPTLVLSNDEAVTSALMPGAADPGQESEHDAAGNVTASSGSYKNATAVVKLLILEYTLVAQVPRDVLYYLRRMKQLKLSPRMLSVKELNELVK